MIGFVYKWTDTSNGMMYIGSHKGSPDDGYIGSGVRFKRAYKKRPESFVREVIYLGEYFRELEDFILKEVDAQKSKEYYNLKNAAVGQNKSDYSKTEEYRKKMSYLASKRTGKKNPFYGKHHTEESKKKIGKANNKKVYITSVKKEYHSIASASRELDISIHRLYNMLYGRVKNTIGIKYV
jgi:hypothetical protein